MRHFCGCKCFPASRLRPTGLTTLVEGFAFLGFEFRKKPGRMLYMWPRDKACRNVRQRVREVVRSFRSDGQVDAVIQKLNPVLNGWCTYFRVGNSNRTFHKVDWAVRSELQLWLRRKHQCPWGTARKRWGYHFLHESCRLYRMVGKVSHLEGLRRKRPEEDDRRAGCGKSAVRFDEGRQETCSLRRACLLLYRAPGRAPSRKCSCSNFSCC